MLRCIAFFLKRLQKYDYTLQICEKEQICLISGMVLCKVSFFSRLAQTTRLKAFLKLSKMYSVVISTASITLHLTQQNN